MNFRQYIEMAVPREQDRARVYYHGTEFSNAEKIIRDGIDPDATNLKYDNRRSWLRPQQGHVYLTTDLKYAIIYALGGDFLGDDPSRPLSGKGVVFEIDGGDLSDISPDEDKIGQILHVALAEKPEDIEKYYYPGRSGLFESPEIQGLKSIASRVLTPLQYRNMGSRWGKGAEVHYQANVGKKLSPHLPDNIKHFLIDLGSHVAHKGSIIPKRAWVIDRSESPNLGKNGENFFKYAKPLTIQPTR